LIRIFEGFLGYITVWNVGIINQKCIIVPISANPETISSHPIASNINLKTRWGNSKFMPYTSEGSHIAINGKCSYFWLIIFVVVFHGPSHPVKWLVCSQVAYIKQLFICLG